MSVSPVCSVCYELLSVCVCVCVCGSLSIRVKSPFSSISVKKTLYKYGTNDTPYAFANNLDNALYCLAPGTGNGLYSASRSFTLCFGFRPQTESAGQSRTEMFWRVIQGHQRGMFYRKDLLKIAPF